VHSLSDRLEAFVHLLPLRVATKFALAFMLCSFVAIAGYAVVVADREKNAIQANVERDLASAGRVLAALASDVWTKEGELRARELLRTAEGDGVQIRVLDPAPARSEQRRDRATARFVFLRPAQALAGGVREAELSRVRLRSHARWVTETRLGGPRERLSFHALRAATTRGIIATKGG